jgi:hypothetical protein
MFRASRFLFAALLVTAAALPAAAKVLAEGKPSGGYYWQKVQQSNGIRYLCRSTSEGKIQKHAKCQAARAVKPQ